jgi:hypothetical protein
MIDQFCQSQELASPLLVTHKKAKRHTKKAFSSAVAEDTSRASSLLLFEELQRSRTTLKLSELLRSKKIECLHDAQAKKLKYLNQSQPSARATELLRILQFLRTSQNNPATAQ